MQLRVTDPTLKFRVLTMLIDRLNRGGMDDLLNAGFSPEFLDGIRYITVWDLSQIISQDDSAFSVSINEDAILKNLHKIEVRRRYTKMREYFVKNYAPMQMMNELFRMSNEEVRSLREKLLGSDTKAGRAKMPPEDVRVDVHHYWDALKKKHPEATMPDLIFRLHQRFSNYGINSLYSALCEFEDDIFPRWQVSNIAPLE